MPDDELPPAARGNEGRGTVARLLGRERPPEFPSGLFVEGDRDTAFAAHYADQAGAVEERMRGETPERSGHGVVFLQVSRPETPPRLRVEANEISLSPQRVDLSVADQR